jgi:hypothetical protein
MYSLIFTQTLPIQYTYFKFDNILIIRILSIYVYCIHYIYTQYTLYLATLWHSVKQAIYDTIYILFDILNHLNTHYILITLYTFLTITDNIRIYKYNTQYSLHCIFFDIHSLAHYIYTTYNFDNTLSIVKLEY